MTADKHILVVGGGGREHAIARSLAASDNVSRVSVAPGNGGTDSGKMVSVDIGVMAFDALTAFCTDNAVSLVVVGPEAPLAEGLVDHLQAAGIPAFGPSEAAARLEASKAFSKRFMADHGIPTADYRSFSDPAEARAFVAEAPWPVVVKASGLAAGKGVIMCADREQALAAVAALMVDRTFGDAGDEVLVEELLQGQEASILAFCDGETVVAMPAAQDHKRALEGDRGPNTGGMGAYAPAPIVDADLAAAVVRDVLQPVVDGMRAAGTPYIGVLYAGLMMTPSGPKVLEFNCRFGDPETQVLLPLLQTDLLAVFEACVQGRLGELDVTFRDGAAATVVAASEGYPGKYDKGRPIAGTDRADALQGVTVYHAGTRRQDDTLLTNGGRVLAVTGLGRDIEAALSRAYAGVENIDFSGMQFRGDIGWRALTRS